MGWLRRETSRNTKYVNFNVYDIALACSFILLVNHAQENYYNLNRVVDVICQKRVRVFHQGFQTPRNR